MTARYYLNSQSSIISSDYRWFLDKNLSNFVFLPWNLHNRYSHKSRLLMVSISRWTILNKFWWLMDIQNYLFQMDHMVIGEHQVSSNKITNSSQNVFANSRKYIEYFHHINIWQTGQELVCRFLQHTGSIWYFVLKIGLT